MGRQTRRHPAAQIRKLGESLEQFGFVLPLVIDGASRVIAGWGLVLAARKIGLSEAPAVTIDDLDEAKLRLLRLALNRLGEESSWDMDALTLEFSEVLQVCSEIDLRISGFEMGEIDVALSRLGDDEEDVLPTLSDKELPATQPGDLWALGEHRLLCGDALAPESHARLLGDERAHMIFTDPPWNIPIEDNVSGLGAVKHQDFAMACGEMSSNQFEAFLRTCLGHAARHSAEGSIHFVAMHWSKLQELLAAGSDVYSEFKNVCVWNKTNAGMGSLYRSKHELILVFKKGAAPHVNNVELGRFGRNRTNVWDYPGQNMFNGSGKSKLSLHPTAKPVALVADAIRDCSNRDDVILDPFGGVGSTLIAAERTGRKARLIELDPRYVDSTIQRWQALTGAKAARIDQSAPASAPATDVCDGASRAQADDLAPCASLGEAS
jgi:DNA modification methylase